MAARRKLESKDKVLELYHSNKSGKQCAEELGVDYYRTLRRWWLDLLGPDCLKERASRINRDNQLGSRNSMSGRIGELHPRYVEFSISTQGYRLVDAPAWYTGSTKARKAPEHIIVACEQAGITELDSGEVVHHKDENKLNNSPDNLEIMSRGRHAALHRVAKHRRKVQRLSRKGVETKQSRSAGHPAKDDDIV